LNKKTLRRFLLCLIPVILYTVTSPLTAQDMVTITANDVFYQPEMTIKAFTLENDAALEIDGTLGIYNDRGRELLFYGWILDAASRKPVWHMLKNKGTYDEEINPFEDSISLPKGNYEIYYTARINNTNVRVGEPPGFLARVFNAIFGSRRTDLFDEIEMERLYLSVSGSSRDIREIDQKRLFDTLQKDAVISINRTGDAQSIKKAFRLTKETKIRVYTLGESQRRNLYDYAWIEDVQNFKMIFQMDRKNEKRAGGALKNTLYDRIITFPAGQYLVYYATDNSHSYPEWNSLPPYDPRFWGITLWTVSPGDRQNVEQIGEVEFPEPILAITKVGNKKNISRTIKLRKSMDIKILCIGEGDPLKKIMYDHGWIAKAGTEEETWKMNGRETDFAGGHIKNRSLCETIRMDRGTYVVGYVTDGSHSYPKWNAAPPSFPEFWGITLWVTNEKNRGSVEIL